MLRRFATILALAVLGSVMWAGPVRADKPFEFTGVNPGQVGINPCTGLEHTITFTSRLKIHEHTNGFVIHNKRTGVADDGFVMDHGVVNYSDNGVSGQYSLVINDTWRHPDGRAFRAHIVEAGNIVTGEYRVQIEAFDCLGPAT